MTDVTRILNAIEQGDEKAAVEAMRRILVENARRKQRLKRGGKQKRLTLEKAALTTDKQDVDLLALNEALAKLEADDPEKASLVKLRYFAGLTTSQSADILKISLPTANRHWSYVRSWLFQEKIGPRVDCLLCTKSIAIYAQCAAIGSKSNVRWFRM